MDFIKQLLPNFPEIFRIFWLFFYHYYGWVLFILGIIYMMWYSYFKEIQHQYIHLQEWDFLLLKVPKENKVSTLAVESIFSQLHSLQVNKTPYEVYVEGHTQLWYSLELISLGGKIHYIVRIPKRIRDVFEAAFYAQYPTIEIAEVNDYMENFTFDPENTKEVDIFGTEFVLTDPDVLPIRTYKDFEHASAEEKIIDPLSPLFETLSIVKPHEFFGVQIIIQPIADNDWKPRAESMVKQLIGEEEAHEPSFIQTLLTPFTAFSKLSYKKAILGDGHHGHGEVQKNQKNDWMSLTEGQKERVTLIEKKASKAGYKTKIRCLYIAPTESFDMSKKSFLPGAFRPFSHLMSNKIKPDTSKTWVGIDHYVSRALEKPYLDWLLKYKKRNIFKGYKQRDIHIGRSMFVLNIEEIASLYHFPITTDTTSVPSAIEKVESKKSQAPSNLPVLDDY